MDAFNEERNKIASYTQQEIGPTEENVKQKFMVPLLRLLGHKTEDLEFEHPTRRGRIDIFIKKNLPMDCRVIIDTKNYSEDLTKQENIEQLKDYAFDENALLAILVNGASIRIYSLLRGVAFEQSLLFALWRVDIDKEGIWTILKNLLEISNLKNRKVHEVVNERERMIREAMTKEEEFLEDYGMRIEGIDSKIESKEDEIETLKTEKSMLEKEIETQVETIWSSISLPRISLNKNVSKIPVPRNTLADMSLSRPKSIAGRVHLSELVSEGLVKDGQIVHLYYRQAYANEKAQILTSENKLKYLRDSKVYSVSELARELLLKNHCIKQKYDVQGPKYWQTESGQTLDELNEIIRKKRGERG